MKRDQFRISLMKGRRRGEERERERERVYRVLLCCDRQLFLGELLFLRSTRLFPVLGSPAPDTGSCKIVSQGICSVFVVCKTVACAGRTRALKKKTPLLQLKGFCFGFGFGGGRSECSDVTLARVSSSWVELGRGESVG